VYTPYGVQTVLTGAWATSSAANSINGFQAGRFDIATGMNHSETRDFDPGTGSWIEADSGYFDGLNLYRADDDNPIRYVDPVGTEPTPAPGTGPTTGPTTQPTTPPLSESEPIVASTNLPPRQKPFPKKRPVNPNPGTLTCKATKHITVKGGRFTTAEEEKKALAALERVLATPRGMDYINQLNAENRDIIIALVTSGPSRGVDANLVNINVFDPGTRPIHVMTPDGPVWVLLSWERDIAHELGHSVTGAKDDGPDQMNNIRPNENACVQALGGYPRIDHN